MSHLIRRVARSLFRSRLGHAAIAAAVFVGVCGLLLTATGFFVDDRPAAAAKTEGGHEHGDHDDHADAHGPASAAPDACCPPGAETGPASAAGPHAGEGHDEHADHDGHAHGGPGAVNLAPQVIETKRCEHAVRTIDCQECRFEVGVVKLRPDVAAALLKTATVQRGGLASSLRLTGEVRFDQTTVADLTPAVAGKVLSVKARLGQRVDQGEVLAVLHSGELGEAKAAWLEALTAAQIAAKERDRQSAVAAALKTLMDRLKAGSSDADPGGQPLGEWRSRLVGASARLQQARAVCERERTLVDKQASSQAELESAQRELATAQAEYAALVEEVELNVQLEKLRAEKRQLARLSQVGRACAMVAHELGNPLAAITTPSADPNRAVLADPTDPRRMDGLPVVDRATSVRYPPGSLFKFAIAINLPEEVPSFEAICRHATGPLRWTYQGRTYTAPSVADDPSDPPHGRIGLERALKVGCNVYFAELLRHTDLERLLDYLSDISNPKAMPTVDEMAERLMDIATGESFPLITPMKMTNFIYQLSINIAPEYPSFLAELRFGNGRPSERFIFPPGHARLTYEGKALYERIRRALRESITDGPLEEIFQSLPITVAGRTAVIRSARNPDRRYAWFVGYAPYELPEYAIGVVVEGENTGFRIAAPAARDALKAALQP